MRYYFAYGLNTNMQQMNIRCPNAMHFGKATLADHKFVFKVHADVIPQSGDVTEGVLWSLTPQCERSLDMLEGYPFYYDKKVVTVCHNGKEIDAMMYYMVENESLSIPYHSYYNALLEGYTSNGLNTIQLDVAINEIAEMMV